MILFLREIFAQSVPSHISVIPQKALCKSPEFEKARTVALYFPTKGEVPTDFILSRASEKVVVFPVVRGKELFFARFCGRWREGKFGIPEPDTDDFVDAESIELFVVPGVAFDVRGGRIGFGGGFYDRVLSRVSAPKFALAWSFQVFDFVPMEEHDVTVDAVFTERFVARKGKLYRIEETDRA